MRFSSIKKYRDFDSLIPFPNMNSIFIPPSNGYSVDMTDAHIVTTEENRQFINKTTFIYLLGKVQYLNTMTNETHTYIFDVRIQPFPQLGMSSIVNAQ